MQADVRQIIDGKLLGEIVTLPEAYKSTLVEIIVTPVKEKTLGRKITRDMLLSKLGGSHTEFLGGALRESRGISLEEIRAERRQKYESPA